MGDKTTSKTAYLLRGRETTHIQVTPTQGKHALRKFQKQGSTGLQDGTAQPYLLGSQCMLWAAMKVKIGHMAESHKHIWPKKTPILPGNHLKGFWARPGKSYNLFQKIKVFSNSDEHLPVFFNLFGLSPFLQDCQQKPTNQKILCPSTFNSIFKFTKHFQMDYCCPDFLSVLKCDQIGLGHANSIQVPTYSVIALSRGIHPFLLTFVLPFPIKKSSSLRLLSLEKKQEKSHAW